MPPCRLCDLPADVYRRICTHLPSQSALAFLLVGRAIYRACNDWIVWREVVRNNSNFSYGIPKIHTQDQQAWKRYVVADSKASSIHLYGAEVAEWLPQIVALNRKLKLTPHSFPITTQELREWMTKEEWNLTIE